MKHAYLILAHNEFDLLSKLIAVLDDSRNDIFIHFDKKVVDLPCINANHANLYIINNRVDVRWGDISVVEAEFSLFEEAFALGDYSYYHLLSGVDFPLKSQSFIHDFFAKHNGKEFIGFNSTDNPKLLERKVNYYHLFGNEFKDNGRLSYKIKKVIRALFLRFQFFFGIKRNRTVEFRKGTQWLSITNNLVNLLLREKKNILKVFKGTFCADEIFVQTVCWNSEFRNKVYDMENEGIGCQRMIGWNGNVIIEWQEKDYETLINADLLFARKFSGKDLNVVNKIMESIVKES